MEFLVIFFFVAVRFRLVSNQQELSTMFDCCWLLLALFILSHTKVTKFFCFVDSPRAPFSQGQFSRWQSLFSPYSSFYLFTVSSLSLHLAAAAVVWLRFTSIYIWCWWWWAKYKLPHGNGNCIQQQAVETVVVVVEAYLRPSPDKAKQAERTVQCNQSERCRGRLKKSLLAFISLYSS